MWNTVWVKYIRAPERSYLILFKNGMVNRLWSCRSWQIEGRYISKTTGSAKILKSCVFKGWHLADGSAEPNNPGHFLKELNEILQMHLDIFLKLCHQQIQKMSLYDILITVNSGSKYDTYTNDPIFLIYSLGSIHRYISFLHFKTYQIQFHVVLVTLHYFLKCKIHVYKPKITPSSLLL